MWRADIRDARVIAGGELGAMWRRITETRRRKLGFGLGLLFWGGFFPIMLFDSATALGAEIASGSFPRGGLGQLCVAVAVIGVYMGGASVINQNRIGSVGPLIRTAAPPRAVTMGRIGSELTQLVPLFGPIVLVGLALVGVGAGSPVVPVLLGVALLALFGTTLLWSRAIGAGLRYLGADSRLSTWGKIAALVSGIGVIAVGSITMMQLFLPDDASFVPSTAVLPAIPGRPLQAYAETILTPLGGSPTLLGGGVLLAVLVGLPTGVAAAVKIETALLRRDEDSTETETATSRQVPISLGVSRSTRVGWRHLIRTVRDPKILAHAAGMLFAVIPGAGFLFIEPTLVATYGPPVLVAFGGMIAGESYCLNPLGDARDQLPFLLTSIPSPAPLLKGRIAAGSILGLPFALIALVLAPFGSHPIPSAAIAVAGIVIVPAGAGIAVGMGAFSPSFERREYMNVERAHPSQSAIMGHLFISYILFFGGSLGLWFVSMGVLDGRFPLLAAGFSWLLTLGIIGGLGIVGYVYAFRRFRGLTLDET